MLNCRVFKIFLGLLVVTASVGIASTQPSEMQSRLDLIQSKLNLSDLIFSSKLKQDPRDRSREMHSTVEVLELPELQHVLEDFRKNCRMDVRRLILADHNDFGSNVIYVDIESPSLLISQIQYFSEQCLQIYSALDQANVKKTKTANKYPLKIRETDIFRNDKRIDSETITYWISMLQNSDLVREKISKFSKSCRYPTQSIGLGWKNQIVGNSLEIDISTNSSDGVTEYLDRATQHCDSVVRKIVDLNSQNAIAANLSFRIDFDDIFSDLFQSSKVLNWISFFSEKPSRLLALRASILDSSTADQFTELKECLKIKSSCNQVIVVHLNVYTAIMRATMSAYQFSDEGNSIVAVAFYYGEDQIKSARREKKKYRVYQAHAAVASFDRPHVPERFRVAR